MGQFGNGGNGSIGSKSDFIPVPYNFGDDLNTVLAHLNTGYYHVHGEPFCYPELADDISISSGTGTWGTGGTITQIIPASFLTVSAFDLHWVNINNISADAYYYIEVYAGDPWVKIGCTRSWRDSTFFGGQVSVGTKRIQVPQQSQGIRVGAKLYSGNAGVASCEISFEGHYYA